MRKVPLRDQLILENMKYVENFIRSRYWRSNSRDRLDELVAEGFLTLVECAEAWTRRDNRGFKQYIIPRIRKKTISLIKRLFFPVGIPKRTRLSDVELSSLNCDELADRLADLPLLTPQDEDDPDPDLMIGTNKSSQLLRTQRIRNGTFAPWMLRYYRFRQQGRCFYCRAEMLTQVKSCHPQKENLEHLVPLSRGGEHAWSNTVLACHQCNTKKGSQTLEEFLSSSPELGG